MKRILFLGLLVGVIALGSGSLFDPGQGLGLTPLAAGLCSVTTNPPCGWCSSQGSFRCTCLCNLAFIQCEAACDPLDPWCELECEQEGNCCMDGCFGAPC